MPNPTRYVGIDLHQDSVSLAVLPEGGEACTEVLKMPNEEGRLHRFFLKLMGQGPVRCCYEASGCGFVLQRRLASWGIECEVIAPSLIPHKPGDRRKTDKRDAENLARLYRSGHLTPVHVPTEAEERVRGLVRCREVLTREILASRHYLLKLLQARGIRWEKASRWTQEHWAWLRAQKLDGEDQVSLDTYLALLDTKLELRRSLDERIEKLAQEPAYREPVARLRGLKGVDTLTAMTLVTEIGDVRRFEGPRSLMGYLGLTVSEFSSGGSERRGGITKAGNGRCRRALVEAAWHYRHPVRESRALKARRKGLSAPVLEHVRRADRRLHKRFKALELRLRPTKVSVAVARELVGFVWALMGSERTALAPGRHRA